ncbi:hypothetical protein E2320_011800 [Naja naja]|nr:hypothetical protein E2320_011800 [Naja naja]
MAHPGRPRAPQSPGPFRSRRDQLAAPPGRHLPYGAEEEEESIRDLSLGNSSPAGTKDGADPRGHCLVYRDPGGKPEKVAEGHQPLAASCVFSPSLGITNRPVALILGIERSSLFRHNAAEKLDTFFSEKLKAWVSDTARLSDTEGAQEETPSSNVVWRAAQKGPAGHHQKTGGQNPRRVAAHGNLATEQVDSSRDNYDPGCKRWLRCPGHRAVGKGQASDGPSHQQEGSRFSTSASSSARILPQCRISHVQRCRACQAFNQDKPVGKGGISAPLQEEEEGSTSLSPQKERPRPPGQPQVPDRITKVQRWLEQTPLDHHLAPDRWHEKHRALNQAGPGARGQRPVYGCPAHRKGETRARAPEAAGDHQSRGRCHPEEREAIAGTPRDARFSPRICKPWGSVLQPLLLFSPPCSRLPAPCPATTPAPPQPPAPASSANSSGPVSSWCPPGRAGSLRGASGARLQAENRVPRIVEAFERRSLREAKIAEREKALQATLQQEPERKHRAPTSHGT